MLNSSICVPQPWYLPVDILVRYEQEPLEYQLLEYRLDATADLNIFSRVEGLLIRDIWHLTIMGTHIRLSRAEVGESRLKHKRLY